MSKNKKWVKTEMDLISAGDVIRYVYKLPGSKIIREGVVTQLVGAYVVELNYGGSKMYIDSKAKTGGKVTLYKKRFVPPTGIGAVVVYTTSDSVTYTYVLVKVEEVGGGPFRTWNSAELGIIDDSDLDFSLGKWTLVSKGVKL